MISSKYGGYFPYPTFRENQELMLDEVEEAVQKENHIVLMIDAPTGSGKTSVIAPILANKGNKRFVVAVRTKTQIEIYLKEISKICNETSKKPTVAYIVGKEKTCKLSSNSSMCNMFVKNTKKFIIHILNKFQKKEYDASSDSSVANVLERKFDGKNPISFEHFINEYPIDENEKIRKIEQENKEMPICPYYLFSKIGYLDANSDKIYFKNSIKMETKADELLYKPVLPDEAQKISNNLCFYELMANAAKKSDIVVLMHSHIVNELIRNHTYNKIGIKQEEAILLIDEAHNIGEETEQKNSEKLNLNLINEAIKQIEELYLFSWDEIPGKDESRLIEYLKENFGIQWITTAKIERISHIGAISISTENNSLSFRLNNEKTSVNLTIDDGRTDDLLVKKEHGKLNIYKSSENNSNKEVCNRELVYNIFLKLKNILENLQKLGVNEGQFDSDLLINRVFGTIDQIAIDDVISKMPSFSNQRSYGDDIDLDFENEPLNKVVRFLKIVNYHSNNMNAPYILIKGLDADEPNKKKIFLEIKNIDPSPQLSKIVDSHYATIMMSGTFSPIDFYELYYFGKNGRAKILPLPSSFSSQSRLIIGINDVVTYEEKRNDKTNYEKCIDTFITDILGNVAIFFNSYNVKDIYRDYCFEIARKNNKAFFEQKKDSDDADKIFEQFKNAAKNKGGALIAPCGGKLSEGMDYKGDTLKAAMVIGLPLGPIGPNDSFQRRKIEHYENRYKEKGNFIAYQLPAMNKALQALGRVIRDKNETGILVLADYRFTKEGKYSVKQYLPSWIQKEMIPCNSLQIGDIIKNWIENLNLKELFEDKLAKINILEEDKELKEHRELLIQEREQLLAEIERVEYDNLTQNANLKLSKEELIKIKIQRSDICNYLETTRLYKSNLKIISSYPGIEKRAKGLGLVGKSSSELQRIIETKENELELIKNKESELKTAKDSIDKHNIRLLDLKNKKSVIDKRINEIDLSPSLSKLKRANR